MRGAALQKLRPYLTCEPVVMAAAYTQLSIRQDGLLLSGADRVRPLPVPH